MLVYLKGNPEIAEEFGVNIPSIIFSVSLAFAHMILECLQLSYEAKACNSSFVSYCVSCFNGRFGWVPFVENLVNDVKNLS